jgi:hypothetical protein
MMVGIIIDAKNSSVSGGMYRLGQATQHRVNGRYFFYRVGTDGADRTERTEGKAQGAHQENGIIFGSTAVSGQASLSNCPGNCPRVPPGWTVNSYVISIS